MPVIISKSHFDKILGHCANSYPTEAGGFLGGKGDTITGIFPVFNVAVSQATERSIFKIGDQDTLRAHEFFEKNNLEVIGFYHSHPAIDSPYPSENDIKASKVRHLRIMMIVSLANLTNVQAGFFTVSPNLKQERFGVVRDEDIKKYL